jgi:hypothetical protein
MRKQKNGGMCVLCTCPHLRDKFYNVELLQHMIQKTAVSVNYDKLYGRLWGLHF